jgi:hypothetical protein
MTAEEQIDFIRYMFERWKAERLDLIAYNIVFNIIKSENAQAKTTLDTLLENARKSQDVRKFVETRFEGFEELINSMGEGTLEKAIREFQEKFGSKSPIN